MNEEGQPSGAGHGATTGQWMGYYTFSGQSERHFMRLALTFRDGIIYGEGADELGIFGIDGRYFPGDAECFWIKIQAGREAGEYVAFVEKKRIWGLWSTVDAKGGFHVWPVADEAELEALKHQFEEEFALWSARAAETRS